MVAARVTMRRWSPLLIAFAMVLAGDLSASSSSPTPPAPIMAHDSVATVNDTDGASDHAPPPGQIAAGTTKDQEWWKQSWVSDWTLVFVTITYVFVTWRTLRAINRQVVAGNESAAATLRSAKATERAIVDVERPRLVVMPGEVVDWETDSQGRMLMFQMQPDDALMRRPTAKCAIVNYGRMPAFVMRTCIQFEVLPLPLPVIPTYADFVELGGVPSAPVGTVPGQVAYLDAPPLSITPRQQGEIGRSMEAVLYGAIEYRGIFPDAPLHVTRFCFVVREGFRDPRLIFDGPPGWTEYT
jgi:hypothetical protein